jgi:hypothetical protein
MSFLRVRKPSDSHQFHNINYRKKAQGYFYCHFLAVKNKLKHYFCLQIANLLQTLVVADFL